MTEPTADLPPGFVKPTLTEIVEIAGRTWIIEQVAAFGDIFFACGILPMRRNRDDLIRDIELSQGPEWRR